jgi:hypothetical protein
MKMLLGIYGINALAFLSNLAAVFVFWALAGPSGYGSYGIYIVFLAVYYLWDIAVIKTALVVHQEAAPSGESASALRAVSFLRGSLIPFVGGSVLLVAAGNLIYPDDPATQVGGSLVMLVVAFEHLCGYPSNRLVYHLTVAKEFRSIYLLRLGATLLRHAFSWGVLLLTGSVVWAIAAIALKGVLLGVFSKVWIARKFTLPAAAGLCLDRSRFALVASFFGAALTVVVMQELPSVYIDRSYGRESLGIYRAFYDLVAAVWFLATIYPTILFSSLLEDRSRLQTKNAEGFIAFWSDRVAIFHLVYFLGVCFLLAAAPLFVRGWPESLTYAAGVAGGVVILGYNRFLVEVAQAQGSGRKVFGATLLAAFCVALFLVVPPAPIGQIRIAWAWLAGQTVFLFLLKAMLAASPAAWLQRWRDALVVLVPVYLVVVLWDFFPAPYLLILCAGSGMAALTVLLLLLRRPFKSQDMVAPSGVSWNGLI